MKATVVIEKVTCPTCKKDFLTKRKAPLVLQERNAAYVKQCGELI